MSLSIEGYSFEGSFTNTYSLKNVGGVYVILTKNSNNEYNVVDVGESSNVRDRIENHDRSGCWQRNKKNGIFYFVHYTSGLTEADRRVIETKIRVKYDPPCGKI